MKIRGVDAIMYRVTDLERSISFYRDTLGLELLLVTTAGHWAEFSVPPTTLGLWKAENTPWDGISDIPPFQPGGAAVYLAVDNIKDAMKELEAKGIDIAHTPVESNVCWTGSIRDPDGNIVILHQRKDGSFG